MNMKQFEPTEKTLGGTRFFIRPFPAFTAARVSGDLVKMLSPMMGGILTAVSYLLKGDGDRSKLLDTDLDLEKLAPALAGAFSSLSGEQLEFIIKELLINYQNISYRSSGPEREVYALDMDAANDIFCGEPEGMFLLAFEVIKINYSGFFRKLGGLSGKGALAGKLAGAIQNTENLT